MACQAENALSCANVPKVLDPLVAFVAEEDAGTSQLARGICKSLDSGEAASQAIFLSAMLFHTLATGLTAVAATIADQGIIIEEEDGGAVGVEGHPTKITAETASVPAVAAEVIMLLFLDWIFTPFTGLVKISAFYVLTRSR